MNAVLEPPPKPKVTEPTVSATRLNTWLGCRLKYYFKYVLRLALNDGAVCRVIHHADVRSKLEEAHQMLGLINERFDSMEQTFQAMSRVKMDSNRLNEYLTSVYPDSKEPDKMEVIQRDRSWSEYFFDQGRGNRLPGVAGTLWAALNGCTEWVDHRKSRQNENQRLVSSWFGSSFQTKARAFSVAEQKMLAWN